MKYIVTVSRIAPQVMDIEVEAKNAKEAKALALDKAPDLDFSGLDKDSEYEVIAVDVEPKRRTK